MRLLSLSVAAAIFCLYIRPCAGQSQTAAQGCQDVNVSHGTMYACLTGSGSVTVVLASGAGLTSQTWTPIVDALRDDTQILTFDRPGLGQSPPGPLPRTPSQIARELRSLLLALEIDGPVILVGHSMGGVHALRYASLFPEQVLAVVTLDTPPPGFEVARLELLSPAEREERRRIRANGLESAPEVVRHERQGSEEAEEWLFPDFPKDLPLTVVVADSQNFGQLGSQEEHRRLWISESRQWLTLSDQSSVVLAEGSGHMIHHDRTNFVAELVRKLLARH